MGSLYKIVTEVLPSVRRVAACLAMLVWSCLILAVPAHAQTVARYTTTTTGTVSDTATPCSNPLKRTFTVGTSQTVSDVNIGVLMAHTYRGDLVITLVSPAGTRVTVVNRVGGGGDNFNALLDDQAGTAVSGYTANDTITAVPPYNRTLTPSSALSAFNGQNAVGT